MLKPFVLAFLATMAGTFSTAAAKPDLRLCTGSKNGAYYAFAKDLAKALKDSVNIIPVESQGSLDNLIGLDIEPQHLSPKIQRKLRHRKATVDLIDGLDAKERRCDAAIAQSDIYALYLFERPGADTVMEFATEVMPEYFHLICSRDALTYKTQSIDNIYGLNTVRHRLSVGSSGSGTALTWTMFGRYNNKYTAFKGPVEIQADEIDEEFRPRYETVTEYIPSTPITDYSLSDALQDIAEGNTTIHCAAGVSAIGAPSIANAQSDYGNKLKLIEVNDARIFKAKNGNGMPIYQKATIQQSDYPEFLDRDITTVRIDAVLIFNSKWKKEHSDQFKDTRRAAKKWRQQHYPEMSGEPDEAPQALQILPDEPGAPMDVEAKPEAEKTL